MGLRHPLRLILLPVLLVAALAVTGCGRDGNENSGAAAANATEENGGERLSGRIIADGSSTVGPLTTAAAEGYRDVQPGVNVEVGISGTGGGFERFCNGETDISNASRPIKQDEEVPLCEDNGIEYTEFQVAVDALTVVVNSENDWVECLTPEQLATIWGPDAEGKVDNWSQVDPSFPDQPLELAGPGTDSGTFDYFTDEINGEEGASRSDYTASEDDNVIVQAVRGDRGTLGYFGFTYFEENQDTLKAVQIENEEGTCVEPSSEAAVSGEYNPLARPLFIYVKNESLQKPELQDFVRYYLENVGTIAEQALYIPPPEDVAADNLARLEQVAGA